MRRQRRAIGPLFDEHQPERILTINLHGVRDASMLLARATCSRLNLRASLKQSSRAVTLPVTTIIASLPSFSIRRISRD
jgi:hypothetical protein